MQPDKLKLSWQTIYDAIEALATMVDTRDTKLIVGVSRGGLIPATLLSHRLGLPMDTISVSAYEGTRRTLEKPLQVIGWDKTRHDLTSTLIVDDILDSGDTYNAIRYTTDRCNYNHNFRFMTLVTKRLEMSCSHCEYFMHVPKKVWVQFPWEQNEG